MGIFKYKKTRFIIIISLLIAFAIVAVKWQDWSSQILWYWDAYRVDQESEDLTKALSDAMKKTMSSSHNIQFYVHPKSDSTG